MIPARLFLETGEIFHGLSPAWQTDTYFGEIVFTTGMVGYTESLTDPSYAGQILTFTYPLIGNYGVANRETWESWKIHARGAIVSELAPFHAHYASQKSLLEWLQSSNVPVLTGVDTRALTKVLRNRGVVAGAITTSEQMPAQFVDVNQQHLVKEVSIKEPVYYGHGDKLIIAIDCGIKESILRNLQQFPLRIKRVPFDYDFTQEDYAGVFVSNGPGDPALCVETIAILQKVLAKQKPVFGICLGAQLMALAIGAKTYKLPFGHRGLNQGCIHLPSGRSYLTSQNHGYSIDETTLPKEWKISFRHLNDNTVQGIEHESLPFFSVQFHPEATPGPVDTEWLFKKFFDLL